MEASYPVDRVTRFARKNMRSVYMEPSYSALISSIHCSYMKYLNLAATHIRCWQKFLLASEFPGQSVYIRALIYTPWFTW